MLYIHDPIFQQCFIFLDVKTEKIAIELLMKNFKEERDLAGCLGFTYVLKQADRSSLYVAWAIPRNLQALVHECCHLAFFMLRDVGVSFDENDRNEVYCYLIDYLVGEIFTLRKLHG